MIFKIACASIYSLGSFLILRAYCFYGCFKPIKRVIAPNGFQSVVYRLLSISKFGCYLDHSHILVSSTICQSSHSVVQEEDFQMDHKS